MLYLPSVDKGRVSPCPLMVASEDLFLSLIHILDKVLANKKLRVAIIPDNPGWSTLGTDNNYTGVDADVARLLADSLGVEVEFENTDGAGRVSMIESDKADVVIACLTATNERAKQVAFSDPYAASGILGLCKADNVFTSWDDLKDKKIAVPRGSTNDIFATAAYPNAEIVRFDAIADAFTALQTGKVDVLLEEDTTVNDLAVKNADMAVMPVEDVYKRQNGERGIFAVIFVAFVLLGNMSWIF